MMTKIDVAEKWLIGVFDSGYPEQMSQEIRWSEQNTFFPAYSPTHTHTTCDFNQTNKNRLCGFRLTFHNLPDALCLIGSLLRYSLWYCLRMQAWLMPPYFLLSVSTSTFLFFVTANRCFPCHLCPTICPRNLGGKMSCFTVLHSRVLGVWGVIFIYQALIFVQDALLPPVILWIDIIKRPILFPSMDITNLKW